MKILAIETSTYSSSIAVLEDTKVMGEYYFDVGPSHTEKLVPSLDWLLKELNVPKSDLDIIAVSLGPGSFTSLRVGISTAKGISYSLGIPVIGVSSLKVLALNVIHTPYDICSLIDARRGEVFAALFRSSNGELKRLTEDMVMSPEQLLDVIRGKTIFVGSGALLYKDFLEDNLRDDIMFSSVNTNIPRASNVALSEIGKLREDRDNKYAHSDTMILAPHYLRKSEAEISKDGR